MFPGEYKKMIDRFFVGAAHAIAGEDSLVDNLAGDAVAPFWGRASPGWITCPARCALRKPSPG